ncbi:MAG: trehalose-phosphatase [Bacteroidetes bacterium]|jgi:alpha,alpha-trehalase|nr:trehalose-phosphatase [Bacteroidota bacterium]
MAPTKLTHRHLLDFAAQEPVFFFDFDGTLVNIVPTPAEVRLRGIAKQVLEGLKGRFPLAIVSGRKLDDVRKLVGIKGAYYSGNHGVEIEGPRLSFVEPRSAKSSAFITSLGKELVGALRPFSPGVNSKIYSLSIHYRTIEPSLVPKLLREFNRLVKGPLDAGKIEVFHGKKVVEVKPPVDWNKGNAIGMITARAGKNRKPAFFGDDTTDEFGFRRVNALGGMSVFVGRRHRKTLAKYWIESPAELVGELAKFLFELG